MNNDIKKVQPFDSFAAVCKILVWAGYYKPLNKPTTQLKRISHQIYRVLALLFVVVYNVQHLIYTVQHRHDMAKLIDCLVIEIPQLNMLAKVLNMFVNTPRIEKIQDILTGPTFAVNEEQDEAILKENKKEMDRLNRLLVIGVTIAAVLWPSSFFVKRYNDNREMVNSYMPFETDTWAKFALSVFVETGPILWTGYGHISLDHLIASYYAHAQTQLKIVKNQLQRLCSARKADNNNVQALTGENHVARMRFQYINLTDVTVYQRFVQIVKRYETLVCWQCTVVGGLFGYSIERDTGGCERLSTIEYESRPRYKNEVDDVFNFPLSVQFLSTAAVVCLVIFRMTVLSVTSFPFMFLALLFFLLLIQVFMYCYYGNLVEFESRSLNDSLYSSDWVSLSPSFRRSLLVAMCRWSRPIQPRVCGIIPLSLNTFVQIVKSSYTLYTVLVIAAKPETK